MSRKLHNERMSDVLFAPLLEYLKWCSRCGFTFKEEFNFSKETYDKLCGYCRSCQSVVFSLFRENNKISLDEYRRNRYANNTEHEKQVGKRRRSTPIGRLLHRERESRRRALIQDSTTEAVNFQQVWKQSEGVCYLCNMPIIEGSEQYDHIVPVSRGGTHTHENIRPTHRSCNARKWAKTPEEYLGVNYV